MINIKILFPGPKHPEIQLRTLDDLLPYQDAGVKLHLGFNEIGPLHCQTSIEETLGRAGMAQQAVIAEKEGMDAIVIESMGDTGLIECREAVSIPVVGMSDASLRIASMLGRKFGIITAGAYHGYAIERLLNAYNLQHQYVGFQKLDMQPFLTDVNSEANLYAEIATAIEKLLLKDVDTVVLGGSYFIGKTTVVKKYLEEKGHKNIVLIDPLPLAIRTARMLAESKLSHSKIIYANPKHDTPIIGYPSMHRIPGVSTVSHL